MLQKQQLQEEPNADTALPLVDQADLIMISGMRLLLSVTALLTLIINPGKLGVPNQLAWLILCSYVLHSAVLFVFLYFKHPVLHGKLISWLDVLWCGLIVYGTGGADSYFFPSFSSSSWRPRFSADSMKARASRLPPVFCWCWHRWHRPLS